MPAEHDILDRPSPEPDRVAAYGPEPEQVADLWLPPVAEPSRQGRPLVVLVHGGFWRPRVDRTHTRSMAARLRELGWPVAAIEYRRIPSRPDTTTADVRLALETVPGMPGMGDARRTPGTVLVGHSAGGQLVLWAAASCPPENLLGTVALAPVADLRLAERAGLGDGAVAAFLGVPADTRADLDPVRGDTPATPVRLVHGVADQTVTLDVGESYLDAHPSATIDALPDTGHFELIDPLAPAFDHVVAALTALET